MTSRAPRSAAAPPVPGSEAAVPAVPAVPVVPAVPGEGSEASGLLAAVEAIAWFVSAFEPARFSGGDAATLV
ncbi:MAG: hypothetical protein ACLQPH_13070, partial [Acidimicrobiales bacterium]